MSSEIGKLDLEVISVKDINDSNYDGIILVTSPSLVKSVKEFAKALTVAFDMDHGLLTDVGVVSIIDFNANRLIFSPITHIDEDYDDVRCFRKAANAAMKRAIKAGVQKPLVYILSHPIFKNSSLITLLGILESLYVPLQVRELRPGKIHNIKTLGVYSQDSDQIEGLIRVATTLEVGRRVACDIGDADPERMAASRVEEYIKTLFANSKITVDVIKEVKEFAKDYPLFEAVNRGSSVVKRHEGRIMFLEYSPAEIKKTLFLVGKGVTYDTGGVDVKINGAMAGMSRDKCGAAAVVGFMQIVKILQPKHLRVVGGIPLVRNTIGSNSYVQDELIKARSGSLVRVGNTDAEGRMIMADVLCKFKEMAIKAVNPHLYTIATLTGHAVMSVGVGYSIVIDNGPAKRDNHAEKLQMKGKEISDPFEVSTLRRDDFNLHKGECLGDEVAQHSHNPTRGHQAPCAFLILASGLDRHGSGHSKPLKYSHIDIAPSAGIYPKPATGSSILALANTYLLQVED